MENVVKLRWVEVGGEHEEGAHPGDGDVLRRPEGVVLVIERHQRHRNEGAVVGDKDGAKDDKLQSVIEDVLQLLHLVADVEGRRIGADVIHRGKARWYAGGHEEEVGQSTADLVLGGVRIAHPKVGPNEAGVVEGRVHQQRVEKGEQAVEAEGIKDHYKQVDLRVHVHHANDAGGNVNVEILHSQRKVFVDLHKWQQIC